MKPKTTEHTPQRDAFLPELADIINPRHELVALTRTIDWERCERELIDLYADVGRPGASLRLLVGLSLLKHTYALSDEVVVQRWEENPYYQWFCGEQYFQHRCPINPTTLLRFRQRLGEAGMKRLLAITVQAGLDSGTINRDSLRVVSADTTVMNKAVAHPTDARLIKRLQEHLVRQAHRQGIRLRQTYEKDLKRLALAAGRYAHARQFKRMRRVLSRMRTRVGRLARDILRQADPSQPSDALLRTLRQTARVLGQGRDPATPTTATPWTST